MGIFTPEDLERLRGSFPKLNAQKDRITSGPTPIEGPQELRHHRPYNCVAWAAGSDTEWWESDPEGDFGFKTYWPKHLSDSDTVDGWVELFQSKLDYKLSSPSDIHYERGVEKVAIYGVCENNKWIANHVARQVGRNKWTSKLGDGHRIEHETLDCLAGYDCDEYGEIVAILRKKKTYGKKNPRVKR